MAESKGLAIVFSVMIIILAIMAAVFSGRSATLATDPLTCPNSRGWAIGSTTCSTLVVIIAILGIIIMYARGSNNDSD